MPLTGGNFARLLEPGLREIFNIAMGRPSPAMQTLFGIRPSTKRAEEYQGMGALGLVPPFQGSVQYEDFAGGYRTRILNYELVKGIVVERSLIDDDQYGEIDGRARTLGDSFAITVEHDAAQIFVNAFTDGGTNRFGESTNGADGVALLSTAHPHSPQNTGDTQSNEDTLDLNIDNLDTTRQRMREFTDDKDELIGINPDLLLVPPELERTSTQLISERAMFEPGSAQFDVNMFAGRLRPLVWDRLTDSNAWFLIDSRRMRENLIWQWRTRPEFKAQEDFDGITAKFRGYMRYGVGWRDWRWIYGNNPS